MSVYLGSKRINFVTNDYNTTLYDTSDATATANQIQKNYTAYIGGKKVIGTLSPSPEVIKTGVEVAGVLGTFTADGTVIAEDILRGKVAYSQGYKINGSAPLITWGNSLPSSGQVNDIFFLYTPSLKDGTYSIPANTSTYTESIHIGSGAYNSYTQTTGFNNISLTLNNGTLTYTIPWVRNTYDASNWNLDYSINLKSTYSTANTVLVSSSLTYISYPSGTISNSITIPNTAEGEKIVVTLIFTNTTSTLTYTYTGEVVLDVHEKYIKYTKTSSGWI